MRDHSSFRKVQLVGLAMIASGATLGAQASPPQSSAAPSAAAAPALPHYRFRLLGVYDEVTGDPMEGVEVSDVLSGVKALTTKTGTVSLFFLPDGGSLIHIRKVGYELQTLPISISLGDTTPVTVTLARATQLSAVNVNAKAPSSYRSPLLAGAEERMNSHNGGYFITEAQLRSHDYSNMANTLKSLPGIMSVLGAHAETYYVSSRNPCKNPLLACGRPDCFISIMVDGVPRADGGLPTDFNRLSPSDYAIAEFYPGGSSVPIGYGSSNGNGQCGVLMLWTREK